MPLHVFDLDHTLLKVNSSYRFGEYLYHHQFFTFSTLLACLCAYTRHKWLGMSVQSLHAKTFAHLFKGCDLTAIQRHVENFLLENFASLLYDPVVKRLEAAQDKGEEAIILSSSPDFLVGAIANRLQVLNWTGTPYLRNSQGKFSSIGPILEGQGKADIVISLAQQMNLPLSDTIVYSDSYLDLPVLRIAGRAIGVKPDGHLKRVCLQNGWEIL